ncbi:hypothetical protein WICMUC_001331 [Wickerhamomyces mucosus]|uniref:Uncharacterized protein n=1 Tax=Wickerhamomyces mucosus TaxID=1378264 RepID=A0A9P8TGQ8_9ASCO|nr:hypothetical protein WICMUC_001331 [Wickerhamomyces mucosus]
MNLSALDNLIRPSGKYLDSCTIFLEDLGFISSSCSNLSTNWISLKKLDCVNAVNAEIAGIINDLFDCSIGNFRSDFKICLNIAKISNL